MPAMYRRLATMGPPALRSLAVELERLSEEGSALAALQAAPAIEAKARRDAQRAAAARAALGSVGSQNLGGESC
jgi:hypothetical protein